jgi:hypothetical protein
MFVKSTTPHNDASFLRTGLGRSLAAALVATGCLAGCDAPSEPGDRALELDDEDLTDEEIDELVAQEADEAVDEADEAQEGQAPAITETVADVLAALPPAQRAALHGELTADQLERPIEITALERAVDVDGNGVLDGMDELTTAPDPVAIGEMACATQALTDPIDGASVAMTPAPNCGYAYDGSTSPNTSYDTAGCPHQYVTEVTGTSGEPLSFYWDWHGANLDQTLCATAHASLTAYGAYFSWPFSINWVKIGTTSVHGVWQNGGLFSYCGWAYDTGKGPIPSLGSNHGYFKVRTATQATGFIFKQQVEGGVVHGDGPC